ncbi:OmpA family protein [Hymenobacter artigasi]|uniref:Outer membrane protein OmpA-like peptidoglycan-associated protein n=1 Tax=Hymenobacter artigasi TaxID=2719616 RepID=A0ABX1HHU9_9BACT|nr:OmpA family protein [Hymenobacter artigasi]NKI89839.1 outer membrane protein OmpA-like peptidoglycan-associated protein [Hymenobacter artigasi]
MKTTFLSLLATATVALVGCDNLSKPSTLDQPHEATADTAVVYRNNQSAAEALERSFDRSKNVLSTQTLPEIKQKSVTVTGDADFEVYSVDETVLFDTDKSMLKPTAAATLDEIVASIGQRFANKNVRVMGFADSRGDASYNLQLGHDRADAVKKYLVESGKLPNDKVSTESFGEQKPVATNETAAGRKANRRVEIAVRVR